ncbi:DUF1456 family protein [Aquibacillus albus]|uniref:Uncharacterized protein YehS (DUF1456 family) n=1 Tax=Aquibacillus albus TaxID=1168171 RepID=A0ABS2N4E9_9BACI|nr:DUF1456 family protein [Aquibacillus albus]MBM7573022.1 uncharacterized protein YehS (DUF1456 family) [Aquibacillus albus]
MSLDNNDILIRIRYALDIKDHKMVEIFELGGVEVTVDDVQKLLTKAKDEYDEEDIDDDGHIKCTNAMLESFLNGLITFKRGKQDRKPGQPDNPERLIKNQSNVNNVLLKKLKIALTLTSEDMIDILAKAGVRVSKGEISALLRKEGHKNYKECGDKFARNFLKGLALSYR